MFCREQVAQLRDEVPEIRAAGAELVVVGSGRPEHARAFRDERHLDFPLYVDTDLKAYAAAGLRRGLGVVLGARVLAHGARALGEGFRQGSVQGDPWQAGGTFVARAGGEVVYAHVSREAGDHPPMADVMAAVKRLAT